MGFSYINEVKEAYPLSKTHEANFIQLHSRRLVIVGVEEAQTIDTYQETFLSYAQQLSSQGSLTRIFVDESHVVLTNQSYRQKMADLIVVRTLQAPITLLTATLPPSMEHELKEAMLVPEARVIRAESHRPNIELHVEFCENGKAMRTVIELVKTLENQLLLSQKCVVYCKAKSQAVRLSSLLHSQCYTADMDPEARKLSVADWLDPIKSNVIVATTALGTGIEIPDLMQVFHLNLPFSAIDFIQESGRCGRQGQPAKSTIVVEERELGQTSKQGGFLKVNEQVIMNLVSNKTLCRRFQLSEYIDGTGKTCKQVHGLLCDICKAQSTRWTSEDPKQGLQLYQKAIGARGQGLEGMKELISKVSYQNGQWGLCPVCFILSGEERADHSFMDCKEHEDLQWGNYLEFGRHIKWPRDYSICIRCAVWHKECQEGSQKKNCKWKHAVVPLAMALRKQVAGQRLIDKVTEGRINLDDKKEYAEWLSRAYFKPIHGLNMLNIHKLIAEVVDKVI